MLVHTLRIKVYPQLLDLTCSYWVFLFFTALHCTACLTRHNSTAPGRLARNYEGAFQISSYLRRISVIWDFGTRNTKKNTKTHLRISVFNTHYPPTTCVPRCFILTTHSRASVFYIHHFPVLGQCRAYGGMGQGLYVIWGWSQAEPQANFPNPKY